MHFRRLRMEPLEDRRMLATFTVTNLLDGAVTAAGQLPGSLRQAIFDANALVGADEIVFENTTGTINLTAGEYVINQGLTITGPGRDLLTIDARNGTDGIFGTGDGSRIFNIYDFDYDHSFDVFVSDLTLTGSDVGWLSSGGAIRSYESLTIVNVRIMANYANQQAGGIYSSGDLTILHSTVSDNVGSYGGGVYHAFGNLRIEDSVIVDNSTTDDGIVRGGGVGLAACEALILRTTISDNRARFGGGGIDSRSSTLILRDSLVSGNISGNEGGGIASKYGDLTIIGSTISGNTAETGGGIYNRDGLTEISHSTIANNERLEPFSNSHGIVSRADNVTTTRISSTIVYGHVVDVSRYSASINPPNPFQSGGYNVIGTGGSGAGFRADYGDKLNVNPLLGPLQNNGGSTKSHALLLGSPALDAGDPTALAGINEVPQLDQRGFGYSRVFGGRIDIGAVESQPHSADFDGDGDVDGRDFLAWQRGYGIPAPDAIKSDGDADDDTDVDSHDLAIWQNQYSAAEELVANLFSEGGTAGLPSSAVAGLMFNPTATRESEASTLIVDDEPAFTETTIDAAFDDLSPTVGKVADFGDFVSHRHKAATAGGASDGEESL